MALLRFLTLAGLAVAAPAAAQHEGHAPPPRASVADWAKGARLFDGLGGFHRKITTASPEAQRYFDQGMRFVWAFNHDEATRSFARAAELDPSCASCWWGVALTLGPNYNMPVMAEARAKAGWIGTDELGLHRAVTMPAEMPAVQCKSLRAGRIDNLCD